MSQEWWQAATSFSETRSWPDVSRWASQKHAHQMACCVFNCMQELCRRNVGNDLACLLPKETTKRGEGTS